MKDEGVLGSLGVITECATRRRWVNKAKLERVERRPAACIIARLMTTPRDHLPKTGAVMVTSIKVAAPVIVEAREIVEAALQRHELINGLEALPS